MAEKQFVTYEQFGAVGDGKTNDFFAIKAAHDHANENGLSVKATAGKTYYISDTRKDGITECVTVRTDVDWRGAEFVIDDSIFSTHEHGGMYPKGKYEADGAAHECRGMLSRSIFEIISDYPATRIDDKTLLEKVVAAGLNKKTAKIDLGLGYPALIITYNLEHPIFKRRGYQQWRGQPMHEVILLDKDGNVSSETPLMWDYDHLDSIEVLRADVKPITVEGGKFTTLACNTNCVVYDEAGNPTGVNEPYIKRGIHINRSNTTLKGVEHYVVGEISINSQKRGEVGPPYHGFFESVKANHLTFENCVMTARRCYNKMWIAEGFTGTMGTYDMTGSQVNMLVYKNCSQSNFWVTLDENNVLHPANEGDRGALLALSPMYNEYIGKSARMHWGVCETHFCKNMEYYGCTLSRFDAHEGVCNGKLVDSTVVSLALTGCGKVYVENSRIFAESHSSNSLFGMRADYGSTWDGSVTINGLKAYMYTKVSSMQNASRDAYKGITAIGHSFRNWYHGYVCRFPDVTINSLEIYDIETGELVPSGFEINLTPKSVTEEPALHLSKTINTAPSVPYVDNDGDGFVDGTDVVYNPDIPENNKEKWKGIVVKGSRENLNVTIPPVYIKVTNNKHNYVYVVEDVPVFDNPGFFGKTEFITDSEVYVGTNHVDEKTETFNFVKRSE